MLNRQQKESIVNDLAGKITNSKTAVVCAYQGMDVASLSELRNNLRENDVYLEVVKKSLTQIAFEKAGIKLDIRGLEGQTAVVYGGDEVVGPKTLHEFSKKCDKLQILVGSLEGKALENSEILNLAKLPSKEELLAKLLATLKSPISGFVSVLGGNQRSLVYVLNAIKEAKNEAK